MNNKYCRDVVIDGVNCKFVIEENYEINGVSGQGFTVVQQCGEFGDIPCVTLESFHAAVSWINNEIKDE